MAKKENVRVIVASEDIAKIIDAGAAVNADMKDYTDEDKAIKAKITGAAKDLFGTEEVSVKIQGTDSTALVTAAEVYTLNTNTALMKDILALIDEGQLTGVIERKQSLSVSAEDMEKAAGILKQAGVNALISESFPINAEAFRKFKKDFADKTFLDKLVCDVARDVTYRVKYEENPKKVELENTKE